MNRVLRTAILGCILLACAAQVASGRFVDVTVEVFRPWGPFGLGRWESLETRFISSHAAPIAPGDAQELAGLRAVCAAGSESTDARACRLLSTLTYAAYEAHALKAELGKAYRVVLHNLADITLGIVLSVDGLNTNGGAPILADRSDRKWVLLANQTVRISGWQISEDEALQFRFVSPSQTHSPLIDEHGGIAVYVYLPDPLGEAGARGTEAGAIIGQPTVRIPFASATSAPVETITFDYAADAVRLGILCADTDGPGIRIVGVVDGSIAALRGLRVGDVITYANALPINSCQDLADLLGTRSSGDRIVLKVHRVDRAFLLTLELGG